MQTRKLSLLIVVLFFLTLGKAQVPDQIAPLNRIVSGNVASGYIFITQSTLDSADTYPTALCLMDSVGNHIFFKAFTQQASGPYTPSRSSDFKLQPSGLLSYASRKTNEGMAMYLLDTNFAIVDSIQCTNGVLTDGHDFLHFPDGSYHLVGTEERTMDLSGIVTSTGLPGSTNAAVIGNVIQRFDTQKNLKFEWKSLDYFEIDDVYSYYFSNPNHLDHSHYNSIDIDDDGNYILSFRHLNEITKVDSSSGEIIWRFGGKENQFTFLGDTMPFSAQHDARRIENGNITLFDNGSYNSTPVARGIEYQMDEINKTATAVWQFSEPNGYSSQFIGNTNRLPNGNTLIDWGGAFPLPETTSFTEVDAQGNIVMELDFIPNRYVSYRAVKQELPFSINRPVLECDGQNFTLTAPTGYSSYQWNTGDETQSIIITDTGTYQVWVNQGIGYMSSEQFYISDLDSMCNSTNINEFVKPKISIYPNPGYNEILIEFSIDTEDKIQVINSSGQLVEEFKINNKGNSIKKRIDIRHLPAGFYMLKIGNSSKKFIKH